MHKNIVKNRKMATSGINNVQKFCLEHMVKHSCSRPGCKFDHYERRCVQVINVKSEEGFVEGRLSYIPLCRYYMRGSPCRFADKCRFRHEINVTLPPPAASSTPSTSTPNPHAEQSKDKTCGICFETIVEKSDGDRRFGILPNCTHCYCMNCIYKWRQSRQFEHNIIKACPECRVTSDFVYPSHFWVENKEEKERLIDSYKKWMGNRDCKYFNKGAGKCPFGNKCFYKHAFPDGRVCDVGPPRRRRARFNITRSEVEYYQHFILWDVIGDSDDDDDDEYEPWHLAEDLDDFAPFLSDDSDLSDIEFLFS